MDPNETLRRIRALVDLGIDTTLTPEQTDYLIDMVKALDGWLTKGGFLPQAWATTGKRWSRS